MSVTYSLKDVAEHNSKESPWFIIHGKVYDITQLLAKHPGGEQVLLEYAGKDATGGFESREHSDKAKAWMKDFEIGQLGGGPKKWYQCALYQVVGCAVAAIGVAAIVSMVAHRATKH